MADTQFFLAGMVSDGPDPYDHEVSSDDILKVRAGDLGSLRVAVSADLGFVNVHPEMRATFETKIERIEGLFGKVTRCDPPLGEINLIGAYKSDLRLLSFGLALEERTANDVQLGRPVPAALKDVAH